MRHRFLVAAVVLSGLLGLCLTGGGLYLTALALRSPTIALVHGPPAGRTSGIPAALLPLVSGLHGQLTPGT